MIFNTSQCEYRQLARKRAYKTSHVAHSTLSPVRIVNEVYTAVIPVHHSYHQQIRTHQKITQRQIDDQKRVNLISMFVFCSEHDNQ